MSVTLALKHSYRTQIAPTHPLILALVALVMDLLLDQVLVRRIIGVKHLDRLPPSTSLTNILRLKRQTCNDNGDSKTLRINTRLHQLLRARKVFVPTHQPQRSTHTQNPTTKHNPIAILARPVLGALRRRLLRLDLLLQRGLLVAVLLLRVARGLVAAAVAVGADDGGEGAARHDEEGAEGQGQRAEGWVAS